MKYIDGFLIPVQKDKLHEYRSMAEHAGKIWMEYGALEYVECEGDDLNVTNCLPFPKLAGLKENETILFSYIVFKSKEHRNDVNAKVMNDSRISGNCDPSKMPFNIERMAYGGFKPIVEL